jgi:hypothetical protein
VNRHPGCAEFANSYPSWKKVGIIGLPISVGPAYLGMTSVGVCIRGLKMTINAWDTRIVSEIVSRIDSFCAKTTVFCELRFKVLYSISARFLPHCPISKCGHEVLQTSHIKPHLKHHYQSQPQIRNSATGAGREVKRVQVQHMDTSDLAILCIYIPIM